MLVNTCGIDPKLSQGLAVKGFMAPSKGRASWHPREEEVSQWISIYSLTFPKVLEWTQRLGICK